MNLDNYEAEPSPELYARWSWTPEYPNIRELEQRIKNKNRGKKEKEATGNLFS